jgi:DNA-binding SARP family transcriptional activator/energy-coupling factor transporter ATP-binding protein EcfA2
MLELNLLGVPELKWQGQTVTPPAPKPFAMLCYLALQSEGCSRKELAELLWEAGKTGSVRVALAELRNLPGAEDWLVTDDQLVQIKATTDVRKFSDALENENYSEALSICKEAKTFLKGLELRNTDNFMNWLELERSRLNELYLTALQGRISELEKQQKYSEAIKLARALLEQDKLNEDIHRAVIRLEHKRGNDEAALQQFENLWQILQEELEVEPLEETLELLREIEGGSVSRAKAAIVLKDVSSIPAKAEKLFGREPLLKETQSLLQNGERVLLQGLGGSGKTALAAAVAEGHLRNTKNGKVLWLQAGDDDPDALFDAVARAFDARQSLNQTNDKAKIIQDLLVKNKITLFVLDDVWNAYGLSKLMEALPKLQFIVTSRQRYPKLKRVDVGRLTREAAIQLLEHHALPPLEQSVKEATDITLTSEISGGVSRSDGGVSDAGTNKLCEVLGDHAFAVRIAGITLAADGISASELLERIKDTPHTLKPPAEFAEAGRESVSSLLNVSLAALSDEAHEALLAFGVMFSSSLTPELLAFCTRRNEEVTENALAELQKRGLAERVSEAGSDVISYRLHDLVFSFARANNNLRVTTAVKANKTLLEKHQHNFEVLDTEINNVLGAVEVAKKTDTKLFVEMMRQLVVGNAYYQARGHSPRSFELLKVAIEKAKELGDLNAAHYLVARMGDTYRELYGNLDKALEAFEEALELARKAGDHHREAITLSLIGVTAFELDKNQEATNLLDKAYELAKIQEDDASLTVVLQHIGYIAGMSDDYEKAKFSSLESVQVAERMQTRDSAHSAEANYNLFFALLNLGEAERKLGNFEGALASRKKALEIARTNANEVWMAYALQEIGEMYHDINKRELARENYAKALELYRRNRAKSDEETLSSFMSLHNYLAEQELEVTS